MTTVNFLEIVNLISTVILSIAVGMWLFIVIRKYKEGNRKEFYTSLFIMCSILITLLLMMYPT